MKIISLFLLVFCISFTSIAQHESNYKSKSVSFSFNGFNLSSYYGGVGGRIWVSESTVLSVSLGGFINERKYNPTANYTSGMEKNKYLNAGIGVENHLNLSDDLSPYFSSRLSFGYNDRYFRYSSNIQDSFTDSKENIYSINLDFGFGIEFWIHDRISLSGQHLFNMRYETGQRTVGGVIAKDIQDIRGFGLNLGTTSMILSIYF